MQSAGGRILPQDGVQFCLQPVSYTHLFHGIFGIVLASTLVIIPTSYVGAWEIVLSAVCCIGGFLLAYFMARLDRRIQENGRA